MKRIEIQEIINCDREGKIAELLAKGSINSVSFLTAKRGYVHGNHYHKYTTHYNYIVSGKVLLVTQMNDNETVKTFLKKGEMYKITPMEKHAIFAMEDTEILILARGPNDQEEFESDTYPTWEPLIR